MATRDTYARWRYRLIPDHVLGELLAQEWIDNVIPLAVFVVCILFFGSLIPNLLALDNLSDLSRTFGEYLLIGLGLTIVIMAGGIDLSVGSVFAFANLLMLALGGPLKWPLVIAIPAVLCAGGLIGLVNGVLIGYLRLRAFLTTLVMLIVIRALVDTLLLSYSHAISTADIDTPFWNFLAFGSVFGMSASFLTAIALAFAVHLYLTRLRPGWHVLAVGGSRRAAHNAGVNVRRTICATYVASGALAAAAGIFYAARLASLGNDTGVGLEITVLTAVVLGGNSLGGGRGSVVKTVLGVAIVVVITNSLIRLGLRSGASPLVMASS